MEAKQVIMTEDEFYEKFNLVKNHIEENAAFDGAMFETYGPEEEFIRKTAQETPSKVWTIIDCDGKLYYSSGFHYVDRLGYLITEEAVEEGTNIEVELEEVEPDEVNGGE